MNRALPKPVLALVITFTVLLPLCCAAQQKREPLTKAEVVDLLKSDVTPQRVESLARQYGVAFEMNPDTESLLRDAGATDELITALREIAPKPTTPPTLLIEAAPGGAQVFVDDELIARTSPEGRLKISTLPAGHHNVRIALDGYRDYEQSVTLTAGQTAKASTALQAVTGADSSRLGKTTANGMGRQSPGSPSNTQLQRLIIPQGTVITVRMVDSVDSSRDHIGQEFAAKVVTPISVGDQVVVPEGTDAHVKILNEVKTAAQSSLQLQLFKLTVNSKDYNVASTVYSQASATPQRTTPQRTASNAQLGGLIGSIAGTKGRAIGTAIGASSRSTSNSGVQGLPQTVAVDTKLDFTLRMPVIVMQ
jgi:hypothetical protein